MNLKRLIISSLCCVLLGSASVSAATITVTSANISSGFGTFSVTSDISGFANTGDIAHYIGIIGLQNAANGEEAINFAPATGFPSTGQSTPDHSIPPGPASGERTIDAVSVIVDFVLNTFSATGVLQGDWNFTTAPDYTIILGLQNNNNGEEAITFTDGVTVSAPSALGPFSMALVFLSLYRRRHAVRRG